MSTVQPRRMSYRPEVADCTHWKVRRQFDSDLGVCMICGAGIEYDKPTRIENVTPKDGDEA